MLVMKHPWNKSEARGRITEVFGSLCAAPDMVSEEGRRQAVFFDGGHGKCEMHEFDVQTKQNERLEEGKLNNETALSPRSG